MSGAFVGKPLDRVDARRKVTGTADYTAEIAAANVAYGVIVGATISCGRVAVDPRAAERAPGVLRVLTPANAPRLPAAGKREETNARRLQLLQDDTVAYDGQPVALVIADAPERAEHAASLVEVRYEALAHAVDLERARAGAFVPEPSGPRPPPDSERGAFAGAFDAAPVKVDAQYTTPIENHNPMELHATVAVWRGSEHVTLYDTTQWVDGVRGRVAEVFGLPRDNVRVVSHFLGGGFGCKGSPWSHVMLAVMGARAVGRPVKVVITRHQMFQFVGYRPQTIQRVSLGAKKDGALVAVRHDVLSETSRFDTFMEPAAYLSRALYACPNVRTSHRLVRLDVSTPTFMRAPGEASGSFALESAMDELADALAMDPLELRVKNYAARDLEEDKPYSSKSLRECYRRAAERFGWARRPRVTRATREGRALVGWGMATATYPARQSPASARARIDADGAALVTSATHDLGTGTYTIMTQVAADALGIPPERVRFELGDTELPDAPISAGSQTASSVGSAVRRASLAVRAKLAAMAVADPLSPLHGLRPEELDADDGRLVFARDRSRADPYASILTRARAAHVEAHFDEQEKEDRKRFSCHAFGAHMIEVKVDEDLGNVRVTRAVTAIAAGRVLNAKTARSQLMGGVVWGIGLALQERTVRDERTGRVVTKDLAEYLVPVNADVPDVDVLMIDEVDPYVNEVGAKGMGEIGIVGVGAAIANAVFHATGRRVRDLPITLDKML